MWRTWQRSAASKDVGMDYYRFIATLDNRTPLICRSHDGRIISVEEASPGDNLPPLHPNCRSTIAGSLYGPEDGHKRGGTRIARTAKGKSYYVPADMTYPEWEEKYVVKAQKLPRNPHSGKAELVDITPGTNGGDTVKVYEGENIPCDTEMDRRKVAEENRHEIIDKPTYCKLTNPFIKAGGIIIRGEFAKEHLKQVGATASYMTGANLAFITDDATVFDVLEEMYHAKQDRSNMFGKLTDGIDVLYRREIDAQKYLLKMAKKYKIPREESDVTRKNLEMYEEKLRLLLSKR